MAASTVEVPVFTDTNLGTRIAMAVPLDITARDFKSEPEISLPLLSSRLVFLILLLSFAVLYAIFFLVKRRKVYVPG